MKLFEETRDIAYRVLDNEADAITKLKNSINRDFYECVKEIYQCKGRVIITGIGKSALIANKIAATLNSTGTRAIFMHAADAVHGDLGMVLPDDLILVLSKSGSSPEIKVLIPAIKQMDNKVIAMVGNLNSYLAQKADLILDTTIGEEACPNNLAPTTSTSAQMVMGDALAICLIEFREFGKKDFAQFHPGGALGKKLYLRVSDIYLQNAKPCVYPDTELKDLIMEMTSNRLGAAVVVSGEKIVGMITDGDLRRMLNKSTNLGNIKAKEIMSTSPRTVDINEMAIKALDIMQTNKITQLIVTGNGKYLGMVHIHDLYREGLL